MDFVLIHTFPNDMEAQLAKSKLESEGIQCFLVNEHFSNLMPVTYQMLGAGVQLKVLDEDKVKAMSLLHEMYPPKDVTKCPSCGSTNFEVDYKKYRFALIGFIILIGTLVGNLFGRYKCKDCGTVFRTS